MESPNEKEGEHGSVHEVSRVAWPIVVSMISYTGMGVADTLFVGWLGTVELAAVGLATTAFFLVNSFFVGTLHGGKVLVSQATGAEKHEEALNAGWHTISLALPAGLIVLGLSAIDVWIFAAMGGPAEVQELALVYFGARIWAGLFWYGMMGAADYFQGIGDTKTPMKVNLLINVVNVVLDIVLIFGLGPIPAMGVAGAAWATVAASAVGAVLMVGLMVKRHGVSYHPSFARYSKLLEVGLPIGVRYVLNVAGFTVFTAIVARMGAAALAAHQITFKIISVSFLPGYGLSEAATILAGKYVGAGKHEYVRRSFNSALMISVVLMGVMGVFFWAFPESLIRLFNTDPEVLAIGSKLLILAAFFQVFDAVAMTGIGALNGTGDTRFTMMVSIAAVWTVQVPVAFIAGVWLDLGVVGAWMGITAEIVVLAIVVVWRFHTGAWQGRNLY